MIARITTVAGKRDEMIAILQSSARAMPGCLSYMVATDQSASDVLWVTEAWDNQAAHDAALSLRQVQDAIPRARSLVIKFDRIAMTTPVWSAELNI